MSGWAKTNFVMTAPHQMKDFYGTVTVNNRANWAAEVNYAFWGMILRAVYDRHTSDDPDLPRLPAEEFFNEMGTCTIAAYRVVTHGGRIREQSLPDYRSRGPGIAGRIAWAKVGFYGNYADAAAFQLNGKRDDEPRVAIPSTQLYQGTLTFVAGKAEEGMWTGEGVKLAIRLSKTGPRGNRYEIVSCRLPGLTDAAALERAKGVLRGMDLLDE